jgi:hypothetical protein
MNYSKTTFQQQKISMIHIGQAAAGKGLSHTLPGRNHVPGREDV